MSDTGERFQRVVEIMARLRAPGGCPWDREQTFDSIKSYTLEETYEVLEAIDARDWDELAGELGDLLLQVLFYAQMAGEEGHFTIDDVIDRLSSKLIGRHPHVFGDVEAKTAADVVRNWQALKVEEKKKRQAATDAPGGDEHESILAGVSSAIPALLEAFKLSSRAAHVGFEWPRFEDLLDKLHEEIGELRQETACLPQPVCPPTRGVASSRGGPPLPDDLLARMEDEVGDLLFVLVNVARYLSLDPESALKKTNRKFKRRFQWMERQLRERGGNIQNSPLDEMEALWQASKREERIG